MYNIDEIYDRNRLLEFKSTSDSTRFIVFKESVIDISSINADSISLAYTKPFVDNPVKLLLNYSNITTPVVASKDALIEWLTDSLETIETSIVSSLDHGTLSGLSDDDHTQYHNNARGDARYYTQAQVDSLINTVRIQSFIIACSDETTALTVGTAKVTFRMPYNFTITDVLASVTTAPTGSVLTVDINENGVSILSTKLTIDATEKTSTTAATPKVISDSSISADSEMTIDIDTIGSGTAGAGLKVTIVGYQA